MVKICYSRMEIIWLILGLALTIVIAKKINQETFFIVSRFQAKSFFKELEVHSTAIIYISSSS